MKVGTMTTTIMMGTMSVIGTSIMTTTTIGIVMETRMRRVDPMFHLVIERLDQA